MEILINDHQVIKRLLSSLTQAPDSASCMAALEQLKAALTIHNATEENLVYPALDTIGGKHMKAQHLYHETAAADVLVFQIDTMLKSGDGKQEKVKNLAETLQAAILEHIEDEEESAFPRLRKQADPSESQLLTASVREFRSGLRFESTPRS